MEPPRETTPMTRSSLDGHFRAAPGQAAVDGHEVHTLAGLLFDLGEQVVRLHAGDVPVVVQDPLAHGIHGHRAQRTGAGSQHAGADGVQIPGDGKIHDRIGAGFQSHGQLALSVCRQLHSGEVPILALTLMREGWPTTMGARPAWAGLPSRTMLPASRALVMVFRGKALFLGKGGQMLVQKAAQGGIAGEDGRHGFASFGLDAGRKKKPPPVFAGAAQLPYGSANCVRFTGSGTIPLSAVQLPSTAPLAAGTVAGFAPAVKGSRRRGRLAIAGQLD